MLNFGICTYAALYISTTVLHGALVCPWPTEIKVALLAFVSENEKVECRITIFLKTVWIVEKYLFGNDIK